jgi:hypothetical protein
MQMADSNSSKIFHSLATLLLLLCFAITAFGQAAAPAITTTRIPGSVTGSQVPDSVAYRMVFLSLSFATTPTKSDLLVQQSVLTATGLKDADATALLRATADFKTKYASLYSQLGTSMLPSAQSFRTMRDGLVQGVLANLQRDLSPDGLTAFSAYVANEKNHIETVPELN